MPIKVVEKKVGKVGKEDFVRQDELEGGKFYRSYYDPDDTIRIYYKPDNYSMRLFNNYNYNFNDFLIVIDTSNNELRIVHMCEGNNFVELKNYELNLVRFVSEKEND